MALAAANRSRRQSSDHWPGFVDALSSLLLVIIFLLSVFVLAQFFLGQALSGRDAELEELNQTILELEQTLALERRESADFRLNMAQISASLQTANLTREELEDRIDDLEAQLSAAGLTPGPGGTRGTSLESLRAESREAQSALARERQKSKAARDAVDALNGQLLALRKQLAALQASLTASEKRDEEQQAVIADLGKRLNVALAQKVQELAGYRSEFFGRLREAIGAHPNIKIEGDRFVIQSEVLFASASAELGPEGQKQLDDLASILNGLIDRLPSELKWVLRVDGHTDRIPIATALYPSNWELSTARATAVVRYLRSRGLPAERLAAAGFGEFQPVDPGIGPEANRRNRRIEFKLTDR